MKCLIKTSNNLKKKYKRKFFNIRNKLKSIMNETVIHN